MATSTRPKLLERPQDTRNPETVCKEAVLEQIARRAYEIFEARGCVHGHDVEDWLTAELEVSKQSSS